MSAGPDEHAAAQEATETSLDPSSPYAGMSDDELVSAFLSPKLGSNRSGAKKRPKTGVPMNMDALNELFQRHPEWHWQQVLSWELAPGMTEHEVMIAWGKP